MPNWRQGWAHVLLEMSPKVVAVCFQGPARLSRRVRRHGSREISPAPSLHRASTDALITQLTVTLSNTLQTINRHNDLINIAITSNATMNRIVRIMSPVAVRVASSHIVRPSSDFDVGVTLVVFLSMKSVSSDMFFSMLSMNTKLLKATHYLLISNLNHHHTVVATSVKGSLYPAHLWAEMFTDRLVLYMMSKL